jgi:precorrin-6x reductase
MIASANSYRAVRQAGTPAVRYRRLGERRSRPQRWRDAVAELVEL